MKKIYFTIAFIILVVLFLFFLNLPIERITIGFGDNKIEDDQWSEFFARILLIGFLIIVGKKYNLFPFNGLLPVTKIKNYLSLLIPFAIVTMLLFSKSEYIISINTSLLILFTINMLLVGFFEEYFVRGIILPLVIKINIQRRHSILIGVIISSILFGLLHYINLYRGQESVAQINGLVVFATCMGIFMSGLFLRTESILPVALFHALVDFVFCLDEIIIGNDAVPIINQSRSLASLIATLSFYALLIISGIYMSLNADKKSIYEKISLIKI